MSPIESMKVRLTKAHLSYPVGAEIVVRKSEGEKLIADGTAEAVEPEASEEESAEAEESAPRRRRARAPTRTAVKAPAARAVKKSRRR